MKNSVVVFVVVCLFVSGFLMGSTVSEAIIFERLVDSELNESHVGPFGKATTYKVLVASILITIAVCVMLCILGESRSEARFLGVLGRESGRIYLRFLNDSFANRSFRDSTPAKNAIISLECVLGGIPEDKRWGLNYSARCDRLKSALLSALEYEVNLIDTQPQPAKRALLREHLVGLMYLITNGRRSD